MNALTRLGLVIGLLLLVACGSGPDQVSDGNGDGGRGEGTLRMNVALSHGYGRLHELMGQLREVDKILWNKGPSDPVRQLLKDIATTAEDAHKRIGELVKDDPAIDLDAVVSAELEEATRDAIASTTRNELLTSSGRTFELRMLVSQLESMRYGSHLAGQVAAADEQENRRAYVEQLSGQLESLRVRAFDLLR